jgi:hypothetical protein
MDECVFLKWPVHLPIHSTVATTCKPTAYFNITGKFSLSAKYVLSFVRVSVKTTIISVYCINRLVSVFVTQRVCCNKNVMLTYCAEELPGICMTRKLISAGAMLSHGL